MMENEIGIIEVNSMRIIMTFIWSFLLVSMLNYVAGSIGATSFDFMAGLIVSLILSVLVIFIGESFPEESVADNS
jgi:uncharacterized membrane protein YdjX (TVP38/TMEM64 family)